MTAISMLYTGKRFVIAADGRCRSDDPLASKEGEKDDAQKIFRFETDNIKMAWAVAGMSSTEDGRFDLIAEAQERMNVLAMSAFSSGNLYIKRLCANIKRAIIKARREGKITKFSQPKQSEPTQDSPFVRFFFLGFMNGIPFWAEARFYHDEQTDGIEAWQNNEDFTQPLMAVGSDVIANMMYTPGATVDLRLASYKREPGDGDLEYATSYIRACCDPIALEIDPLCKFIGGQIHAAEVTPSGFKSLRIEETTDKA